VKEATGPGQNIELLLQSAVIVSWGELIRGARGSIQLEYEFAPGGSLECVKVWTSTQRGYWFLACTFRMSISQSHGTGIQFDNGCYSERFGENLGMFMRHQDAFLPAKNLQRPGMLHITNPTSAEASSAIASVRESLERINSGLEQPSPSTKHLARKPIAKTGG